MSWAATPLTTTTLSGRVHLAEPIDILNHLTEAEAVGLLPVLVDNLGPGWRGRLALAIEEAIENQGFQLWRVKAVKAKSAAAAA